MQTSKKEEQSFTVAKARVAFHSAFNDFLLARKLHSDKESEYKVRMDRAHREYRNLVAA